MVLISKWRQQLSNIVKNTTKKNMRATFQDIVLTKYTINVKGPVATNINICKLQYKHIWYPCIYNLCFMLFHWEVLSFSSPKWTLQLLKLMKGCHVVWNLDEWPVRWANCTYLSCPYEESIGKYRCKIDAPCCSIFLIYDVFVSAQYPEIKCLFQIVPSLYKDKKD
jgi:hypothetical protein